MKLSSEDVELELKSLIREVQQERTNVHGKWTAAKAKRLPEEPALKAKLEALSKRVEVLKLALGVADLDALVKRAEALKPFMAALEKAAALMGTSGSATAAAVPTTTTTTTAAAAGSSGSAAPAGNLAELGEVVESAAAGGAPP